MSFGLDASILLYASDAGSPHHAEARAFLERCLRGDELVCIAWMTAMSYLRVATHPAVFRQPMSPQEAESNLVSLQQCPHVRFVSELEGFWGVYQRLTAQTPTRGNLVPDAHLAAILLQHGVKRIYTHDRDFRKFPALDVCDPLA